MGGLAELFVAREEEASSYGGESAGGFPCIRVNGFTNLEFEMLWAILDGVEWDPDVHALRELASTDEAWIFGLPSEFLDKVRALDAQAAATAAAAWAAIDEIASTADEVRPVVDEVATMARSITAPEQSVFLWMSL